MPQSQYLSGLADLALMSDSAKTLDGFEICKLANDVTVSVSLSRARARARFPGSSGVKKPPAMQETWVRFLGQEDHLEEGIATHSRLLA